MNYYKRTFKGGAEYCASSGQPDKIVSKILYITVFWPNRYWLEQRMTFPYSDYERIGKMEFDNVYQKALETFNSILKPE